MEVVLEPCPRGAMLPMGSCRNSDNLSPGGSSLARFYTGFR